MKATTPTITKKTYLNRPNGGSERITALSIGGLWVIPHIAKFEINFFSKRQIRDDKMIEN